MSFASQECTGDETSRQLEVNPECLEQESIAEAEFAAVNTANKTMPQAL